MTDPPRLELSELSVSGSTAVLTFTGDKVHSLGNEALDEIVAFVDFCEKDPGVERARAHRATATSSRPD